MIGHPGLAPDYVGDADAYMVAIEDRQEEHVARGEDLRRALLGCQAQLHPRGMVCDPTETRCHWPPLYVPSRPITMAEEIALFERTLTIVCASCGRKRRPLDPRTMKPEHWGMCASCATGAADEGEPAEDDDEVPEPAPVETWS